MSKTIDEPVRVVLSSAQKEAVHELMRDLEALPKGTVLTLDEVAAFVRRMPGRPAGWTSADVIREGRGPLPEEDDANVPVCPNS